MLDQKNNLNILTLKENDIIISLGPTGRKKFFSSFCSCDFVVGKKIDRVILSRPAVEAGEKLGFLPET